jgi:hypothetical protein
MNDDLTKKAAAEQQSTKYYVDPVIEAYRSGVDLTLIRQNLRLTVDERFEQLMKLQQFAEELRSAGKRALNK